jgi:WD40 repeat protein
VDGVIQLGDLLGVQEAIESARWGKLDEAWIVTDYRVSNGVAELLAAEEDQQIFCYTMDELIDLGVDFGPYTDWLEQEVVSRGIDREYIQLGHEKAEIDVDTQQYLGKSIYPHDRDHGIEGYIDDWLSYPSKQHLSILGEFGTGKTWFTLHYAWLKLREYEVAKEQRIRRPRLPLYVPLRDYTKALDAEAVLANFFFNEHDIRLTSAIFDRLNEMGKIILIFDGFDEMAEKTDKQKMADNFAELARVAVTGSKVILTSRQEHFLCDGDARTLFGGRSQSSKSLKLTAPKFEILELMKFDDEQIRRVLMQRTDEATVAKIFEDEQLLDLAKRPVMGQFILEALPKLARELVTGKKIENTHIYFYAAWQQITAKQTFTTLPDKVFFLCELAWKMYVNNQLTLHYSEFPDEIDRLFKPEQKDRDPWRYDLVGKTLLVRDGNGNYRFAHKSLLEFFVVYKLANELGLLQPEFSLEKPGFFETTDNFQRILLDKVLIDLLLPLLSLVVRYRESNVLLELMQSTKGKTAKEVQWLGTNAGNLLAKLDPYGLEYQDLAETCLPHINLRGIGLREVNLSGADLTASIITLPSLSAFNSIAVNRDNERFFTGHEDGTVMIFETGNNQAIFVCQEHERAVNSVAVGYNGEWLFSGSDDSTIKKWRVVDGKYVATLSGHKEAVNSVAVSSDGQWLFSGSDDNTIKKWNIVGGECVATFSGHGKAVNSIVVSLDGEWLFSGSDDNTIKKWNIVGGECVATFSGHGKAVNSIVVSLDGEQLFSGSDDNTIKKWNVVDGKHIATFVVNEGRDSSLQKNEHNDAKYWDIATEKINVPGHKSAVNSLAVSSDGKWLFSGSQDEDGSIKQWDTDTGKCFATFSGHKSWVNSVAVSTNGDWLFSGGQDKSAKKWNIDNRDCLATLEGHQSSVVAIAKIVNKQFLFAGGWDHTIKKWDVTTGECLATFSAHQDSVYSLAVSPDGKFLFSGSRDGTVKMWDLAKEQCCATFLGHKSAVASIVISNDGKWLFSGSWDRTVKQWKWDFDGEKWVATCVATFEGHRDLVISTAISTDGRWLFSGGWDCTIRKWDVVNGKCVGTFSGHEYSVRSMAVSADGKWLFSGGGDQDIQQWDIETRECLATFSGHEDWVRMVVVSTDGKWLFSGSGDDTIKQWDIETGECLATFSGHEDWVRALMLNDDEKSIFSGSDDSTIRQWDIATGECLATFDNSLCSGAKITNTRGLTPAQIESLKALGAIDG